MSRGGKLILWFLLAAVIIAAGASQIAFLVRYPYFKEYAAINGLSLKEARKAWGHPDKDSEWAMGLAVEASNENWQEVATLASEDHHSTIGTYYYNLSNAMKGQLADKLMDYYQPFERGLFLPVNEHSLPFQIACASDVWYALGDMTMAERDAMLGMLFSPAHTGSRYLKRLAETNLVSGEYEAASKYLRILLNSPRDRAWAESRLPGSWNEGYKALVDYKRSLMPKFDLLHGMDQTRLILRILLNSNPANSIALNYLLCYDLLVKDLDSFVNDFDPSLTASHLYEEAMLIFLASKGGMDDENFRHYGIKRETLDRFNRFVTIYKRDNGSGKNLSADFGKTYWYYFYYAVRNENR